MAGINPIPGAGSPAPIAKVSPSCPSCAPSKKAHASPFGGLLEDALRRLEALDGNLRPTPARKGEVNVEKLQSELKQADAAMRSAEEIRALLLRAYQRRTS